MTNNINFSNVICGEYTNMVYEAIDNIYLCVRKLKNGNFSVMTDDVSYLIKLKRLGYKLRCNELVVKNEQELIEALQKVEHQWTEMKVVIE